MDNTYNLKLENGAVLHHSNKKKSRHFLPNTIEEYRVGYYLWKQCPEPREYILDVSWEQNTGDFSIGNDSFEHKGNRGALSSGYISLEVMKTDTIEVSGLGKSNLDKVDYFLIYLPVYQNYKGKFPHLVDNLLMFRTNELYQWVRNREELNAVNNNFINSNALCYKVPIRYIEDCESFKNLIVKKWHMPEAELNKIKIPKEIYSLFQDE